MARVYVRAAGVRLVLGAEPTMTTPSGNQYWRLALRIADSDLVVAAKSVLAGPGGPEIAPYLPDLQQQAEATIRALDSIES